MESVFTALRSGWTPIPYSWYIYVALYIYFAFYIAAVFLKKQNVFNLVFTILLLLNILSLFLLHWGGWWYMSTPSVLIGFFISQYENIITRNYLKKKYLIMLIIITLLCIYINNKICNLIAIQLFAVLTYICIRLYSFPRNKILDFLGKLSFFIYILHGIVILFIKQFNINKNLSFIMILCMTIVISYIVKEIEYKIRLLLK